MGSGGTFISCRTGRCHCPVMVQISRMEGSDHQEIWDSLGCQGASTKICRYMRYESHSRPRAL